MEKIRQIFSIGTAAIPIISSELSGYTLGSLPYWNYQDVTSEDKRTFPKEYGIMHLDGNQNNNDPANINPLYLYERDYYFCNYEHPFETRIAINHIVQGSR